MKEVESYSGTLMNNDFNKSIEIIQEPKIIVDTNEMAIIPYEEKNLSYTVIVSPINSIINKKLFL